MVRTLLLAVFISLARLFAQDITVRVTTDTTAYLVGKRIKLNVTLQYPANVKVTVPQIKDSIPKLEFISELPTERSSDKEKTTEIRKYEFAGFDSGDVTIPSITFPYLSQGSSQPDFIVSDSLIITIHTVAVDTSKEIKDVRPPLTIPPDYLFLGALIAGILLLLFVVYRIIKYFQKRRLGKISEPPAIKLTPYEEALEKLKALEARMLWQEGKIKEYHSEITNIIRSFFEKEYGIPALESTSSELISAMKKSNMGSEIVQISGEFFENADMVKFAKFVPMPAVNEAMMKQAYRIVELSRESKTPGGIQNV